jgi:hypothetical protein
VSAVRPVSGEVKRVILMLTTNGWSEEPRSGVVQVYLQTPGRDVVTWPREAKKQVQIRRRFMLLGETVDTKRVWDIVRAIEAIRGAKHLNQLPLRIEAEGSMAVNALYASLFAPPDELVLADVPKSHMNGPDYLNVLRIFDLPQAVAMASERCRVELRGVDEGDWQFALKTARVAGFEKNLSIRK